MQRFQNALTYLALTVSALCKMFMKLTHVWKGFRGTNVLAYSVFSTVLTKKFYNIDTCLRFAQPMLQPRPVCRPGPAHSRTWVCLRRPSRRWSPLPTLRWWRSSPSPPSPAYRPWSWGFFPESSTCWPCPWRIRSAPNVIKLFFRGSRIFVISLSVW